MITYIAAAPQPGTFKMKNQHAILWARRICLLATTRFARGPTVRAIGILSLSLLLGNVGSAQTILGAAGNYGVMGGGVVTVTGLGTTITGNLGAGSLSGSVTFGTSGVVVTPISTGDAPAITDFNKAFTGLKNMTPIVDLFALNLGADAGATTLLPGVYNFTGAAALTGNLILDADGQNNAVWVFQIPGTFNTTASSTVTLVNTVGDSVANFGVYWAVTGATVFGASTLFEGNLLDGSTIGFGAGVHIDHGRALTATGTIGLATETINFIAANSGYSGGLMYDTNGTSVIAVPEPATSALIAAFAALGLAFWHRHRAAG
jgi:hypothetical protein